MTGQAHTGWHAQQMDADIIIEERGQSGEAHNDVVSMSAVVFVRY